MKNPDANVDHKALTLLLPWYVNGTLEDRELQQVETHLVSCPECNSEVRELREIAAAVGREQTVPLVPPAPIEAFLDSIDDVGAVSTKTWTPRRMTGALAAAAVILATITAGILYYAVQLNPADRLFNTVTDAPGSVAYVFNIGHADGSRDIAISAIEKVFDGVEFSDSDKGLKVIVSMSSATIRELEQVAATLREVDVVKSVEIVGVQLPLDRETQR